MQSKWKLPDRPSAAQPPSFKLGEPPSLIPPDPPDPSSPPSHQSTSPLYPISQNHQLEVFLSDVVHLLPVKLLLSQDHMTPQLLQMKLKLTL
ncbi:hypothetical protein Bca52824_059789 [Brassica carinata]|uniref:Uncharacterized protein n=1 Tax=Brassica carinata TaxID=52824 RepID=A0A8X7QUX0_BRACI|nr:hypothetical protein Bca52824_059789 [Brassica carinata]